MKIAIDNLGPIKHADIDLNKDLIILCGGNNSGKTYVAYSVYGLYKTIEKLNPTSKGANFNELWRSGSGNLDIVKLVLSEKDQFIAKLKESYYKELPIIFSSEQDFFTNATINIILDNEALKKQILRLSIHKEISIGENIDIIFNKHSNSSLLNFILIKESKEETYNLEDIYNNIAAKLLIFVFESIFNKVHIATAERTAINIFSKELSESRTNLINQILDQVKDGLLTNVIGQKTSRYSLPIRDGLALANRIDLLQKNKSPFAYLADEIEKTILQGKIKVADTGELQFSPAKSKKSLGIHLTASGVKSLASIIFYLRHIAQVGDFFIIDEPELNLHPDNQRKVARVIAQMVNAGIKVMLSTHSDYIIRELNNLIMLDVKGNDKVVNKLIKKYGYQKDQILNPEKVGVYLFTDKVEALEVNATGFEVKSIDDEINALNESAQDIFFTLHDN